MRCLRSSLVFLFIIAFVTPSCGLDLGPEYSKYGGWKNVQLNATGFFRIVEHAGGYWFCDPAGYLFLAHGICHTDATLGLPKETLQKKFGNDPETYDQYLLEYCETYKFNSFDYNFPRALTDRIPYVEDLMLFGEGYMTPWYCDLYDPKFLDDVCAKARQQSEKLKDDPWLMGYALVIHPMLWSPCLNPKAVVGDEARSWIMYFKALPADAPGKQAYVEFMKTRHNEIADYNELHGTGFENWQALLHGDASVNDDPFSATDDDLVFYQEAFSQVTKRIVDAIRSADPNHLIFGYRYGNRSGKPMLELLKDPILQAFLRGQSRWIDASIPELYNDATFETVSVVYEVTQKPVYIADGMKYYRNKASEWRPTIESVLPNPYFLGGAICQFMDRVRTDPKTGERIVYSQGIKTWDGEDKPVFTEAFAELAPRLYSMRIQALQASTQPSSSETGVRRGRESAPN